MSRIVKSGFMRYQGGRADGATSHTTIWQGSPHVCWPFHPQQNPSAEARHHLVFARYIYRTDLDLLVYHDTVDQRGRECCQHGFSPSETCQACNRTVTSRAGGQPNVIFFNHTPHVTTVPT